MKCPRCGFISFDHNETCPKCKKDIRKERKRMHHLPFRPEMPFLIGALVRGTSDSPPKLEISQPDMSMPKDVLEFDMESLSSEESLEIDLGSISEPVQTAEDSLSGEYADSSVKLEIPQPDIPTSQEVLEFDMESLSSEESLEIDLGSIPEAVQTAEDALPVEDDEIVLGPEDLDLDEYEVLLEPELPSASTTSDAPKESPPPESHHLGKDSFSIEVPDLQDVDMELESEDKNIREEALTLEMDLDEPVFDESHDELEGFEPTPEPDFHPISPEIDDREDSEELTQNLDSEPVSPDWEKTDSLFSLDELKEDKIRENPIPDELPRLLGTKNDASSDPGTRPSESSRVWSEIAKDLEELDFDIDESK